MFIRRWLEKVRAKRHLFIDLHFNYFPPFGPFGWLNDTRLATLKSLIENVLRRFKIKQQNMACLLSDSSGAPAIRLMLYIYMYN